MKDNAKFCPFCGHSYVTELFEQQKSGRLEKCGKFEIREYLKRVMELEVSCYKQSSYLASLKNQLYQAQNPGLWEIQSIPLEETSEKGMQFFLITAAVSGAVTFIGMYIFCVILEFISFISNRELYSWLANGGEWALSILVTVLVVALCLMTVVSAAKDEKQKKQRMIVDIRQKNTEAELKNEKILAEAQRRAELLQTEMAGATDLLKRTKAVLQTYYECGIIFEKYRSLVPVAMFYEYFSSGRCFNLEGHEGAYNIYENEIRMNLILTKLDEIVQHLDEIRQNQYILMHEMQQTRSEIYQLSAAAEQQSQQLARISENQDISNYYSEISARNTSYLAWTEFLKS